MKLIRKSEKGVISVLLALALLISAVACAGVVSAEETGSLAPQGAENYYLWGQNTNDPDFGKMSSPTGSFSYDGTKGYYYYDLHGASGDYCFVVSKVNNSGDSAARTPAVGGVASSGKYYLQQGNYHGYACMHLWNPNADDIRIYFTSENAGLNAIPLSEAGSTPTTPPTPTSGPTPTTPSPTSAPGTRVVYCKNDANWGAVYAYMWNGSGETKNHEWPGVKMTGSGSGLWSYNYDRDYENIIFNNGSDDAKTEDMRLPGSGYTYNNATGQWTQGGTTPTTPSPTSAPQPTSPTPTTPTPTTPSGGNYIYCENEAKWSTVTVYMWNSETDRNSGWPGQSMTNIGGNIWRYTVPKSYASVIFSESGNNQTPDMSFPGYGYMYNNATKQWSVYDTSPLQVQSYTTDLPSPQFSGVGIVMSASATGQGTVWYKFSATSSSGSTKVVSDYSIKNSAVWTPAAAGKYTLTYEFKDAAGNTNKRTLSYSVNDGLTSASPYIKQVTPISGQQIKNNTACNITVSAGGGVIGTKLLFFKYTVKDSAGKIINTPYYTRNTSYSFTPTALGKYTLTVSVQGSDNALAERDYVYNSVSTIVNPTEPPLPTEKPTDAPPSSGDNLKGDADKDGEVTIFDATRIQRWLAALITEKDINMKNADADGDGEVTIFDATHIQRWLAGLIANL